jgi:hypothetical protein
MFFCAGDTVKHTFVLTNDGNVALRSLSVGGYDLATVTCVLGALPGTPVANPVPSLPVGGVITCEGDLTFTQPQIELGDATVANTNPHKTKAASSLNKVPPSNTAFTQDITLAAVSVPNNPKLQTFIDLNTCEFTGNPAKEREWGTPERAASCVMLCTMLCAMLCSTVTMLRAPFRRSEPQAGVLHVMCNCCPTPCSAP